MKFKRIFLIVLDSLGVGEAIDAEKYNSKGANTLGHLMDNNLFIPNLSKLGLVNTLTMNNLEADAFYTIARPKNAGCDSLSGHYEMVGIESKTEPRFVREPFPRELLEKIAQDTQIPIIGNVISDCETVINKLGGRQEETGALIIYTTGDSNMEVAANEDVIPLNQLEEYCEVIRNITLRDMWRVNSIIARPYKKVDGKYTLTSDTKRYTFNPPTTSVLDSLKNNNYQVISIGKISDLFNNQGITKVIKSANNSDAVNKLLDIMDKDFEGLCFANLPDFDTIYGHSRNINGYKEALEEFDVLIPLIINKLNLDDLLIITSDHGNDPTYQGVSHTRENVPVVIYSRSFTGNGQIDILDTYADIGATISDIFKLEEPWIGNSFLTKLK